MPEAAKRPPAVEAGTPPERLNAVHKGMAHHQPRVHPRKMATRGMRVVWASQARCEHSLPIRVPHPILAWGTDGTYHPSKGKNPNPPSTGRDPCPHHPACHALVSRGLEGRLLSFGAARYCETTSPSRRSWELAVLLHMMIPICSLRRSQSSPRSMPIMPGRGLGQVTHYASHLPGCFSSRSAAPASWKTLAYDRSATNNSSKFRKIRVSLGRGLRLRGLVERYTALSTDCFVVAAQEELR